MLHVAVLLLAFAVFAQLFATDMLRKRVKMLEEENDYIVEKAGEAMKHLMNELEKKCEQHEEALESTKRVIDSADTVIKNSQELIDQTNELIGLIREEPEEEE